MNDLKSKFPALVDISITSACPFGCEFCYTSSKKEGTPAESNYLTHLPKVLREAGVFEVVFGGGEPTLYNGKYGMDISAIAASFKRERFKVGVTTKNYNFYKSPIFGKALKNIDSLAISCNTVEDLKKAIELREAVQESYDGSGSPTSVYFQCILGVQTWPDFQEFLKLCAEDYYTNLTILGYKDFGFGTTQKPNDIPDEWIDLVKSLKIRVGADSILVNKYREKLLAANVPSMYLVGKEGNSSCYIDAVKQVVKPSSFTNSEYAFKCDKWDTKENVNEFLNIFSKF